MTIEKIVENVYSISDGSTRGNVAAYVLPNQIIFIDSGMNIPLVKKFREKLEKETGKKTTYLLITHTHGDHIFGNQVFKDCKIISSKHTEERMIESEKTNWAPDKIVEMIKNAEDPSTLEGLVIVLPTETFGDQMEITDGDVKVIFKRTGGHTEGSSYVYCPNYKSLTAGDNLFIDSFPWGGAPSANPEKWIAALEEYLSLDIDYYLPGHGPVSNKDKIQEFLTYISKVVDLMRKMIAEGKSEEEIIKETDAIEYHPPKRPQWKELTLKKWYEVLIAK